MSWLSTDFVQQRIVIVNCYEGKSVKEETEKIIILTSNQIS